MTKRKSAESPRTLNLVICFNRERGIPSLKCREFRDDSDPQGSYIVEVIAPDYKGHKGILTRTDYEWRGTMPFKSKAQRRKFHAMAKRGEISKATVKKWEKHTGGKRLPERVGKKK